MVSIADLIAKTVPSYDLFLLPAMMTARYQPM
jgi:hypothetical protein